jgi:uncharacterized ParB-like nuclease family protein
MLVQHIPIDLIKKNAWNPNAMSGTAFKRLVKEIEEVGFLDPIQVVPLDDGTYRIIGGEHRVEAAKELNYKEVPAVILAEARWKDEDLQKFVTVRLNVLHGKLDPGKMAALYDEMAQKYGEDALKELFAYTDQGAFNQMLKDIKRGLKKAGISPDLAEQFATAAKEKRSLEEIAMILNELFANYGDTVQQSFMVFTFGKKEHIYYAMDSDTQKAMKKITGHARKTGADMNDVLGKAIQQLAAGLKTDEATKVAKTSREDDVEF